MAEKVPPAQSDIQIRCGGVSVSIGPYMTGVDISSNPAPFTMTITIQSGYHGPQVVHTVQYETTGIPLSHQTNHRVAIHTTPPPFTSHHHYSHAVHPIMEAASESTTHKTELV